MLGDEDFVQDGKYRNYVAAMEKALKNFEYSSDWPDLINALTKLNKVITAHSGKYKIVPRRLLLTKRLSQCLHPSLPSGVHLKALESYDLLFKSIGVEKLRTDLFVYATGLFPLLNYAGLSVKPPLLKIYENYLLPLQEDLVPCLDGFLQGILLGMEESADNQRSCALLDSIKVAVSAPVFYTVLWKCTLTVPKLRQASINYLLTDRDSILGNDISLLKAAILACLSDTNILVQRLSLELLSTRDLLEKEVDLVKAALRTLLRRDASLNRRLFNWLTDCDTLLIEALQSLLCDNDEDNYRILVYLFDKQSKGCDKILKSVLVDIIRSMYIHNTAQASGSIFFSTLNSHYVWNALFSGVESSLLSTESASVQKPGSGSPPLPELCLLISYLVSSQFLEGSEEGQGSLESFIQSLLAQIQVQLPAIPLSNLICVLNLSKSFYLTSAIPTISRIFSTFVSSVLFHLDVSETYGKLVTTKSNLDAFYGSEDFEGTILDSLQEMTAKVPFLLPPIRANTDPHLLEAFKVLNEVTLCGMPAQAHALPAESESAARENVSLATEEDWSPIFKCLTIASVSDSEGISLCAIHTLAQFLSNPTCVQLVDATLTLEQIASLLWDVNDLVTLQAFIAHFPERIQRLFITKTEEVDFEGALVKIKKLLEKDAPFDRLICKVLDGLNSSAAQVRSRSELFVTEYLGNIGILLSPLLRILRRELALTASVLSGDCRSISEQKSGGDKREVVVQGDKTDDGSQPQQQVMVDRPNKLHMDSTGRFNIPIITPCLPPSEDEFDEIDEDNYLGLLDGPPENRGGSLGDINHNETKDGLSTSTSPVTCLSVTSIDPDKEFEAEMERREEELLEENKKKFQPPTTGQGHRLFSIHPYTTQMLIYTAVPDLAQTVYAMRLLRRILETETQGFLLSAITTVESDSGLTFMELILETVLRALESFVMDRNDHLVTLHVEALRVMAIILNGFIGNSYKDFLGSIMLKLHLPKTILHVLVTLPTLDSEEKLTSTEEIMKLNYENIVMVYRELMRVNTVLLAIESEMKYYRGAKNKSRLNNYSANVPMIRQPLYVDSIRQILSDDKLASFHLIILESVTKSLRFYKEEKVIVDIVKVIIGILGSESQVRDLVYTGKVLEALTTILHFIVLDETSVVSEKVQSSPGLLSNLVSVFVGGSTTPSSTGQQQKGKGMPPKVSLLSLLPNLLSSILGIYSGFRESLNSLLNPIAVSYVPQFIQAVGRIDPIGGAELVSGMKVLSLESLVTGIDSFLKQTTGNGVTGSGISPATTPEEDSYSIGVNLLTFLAHFLDRSSGLSDVGGPLMVLVKGTFTLPIPVQLGGLVIYYKLVKATVGGKEMNKELQDLGGKLLDSICTASMEKRSKSELTSTQILETLNQYLTLLLDLVWGTSEEKLPINTIIGFLMVFLRGKFPLQSYVLSTSLLAKLSLYPNLRKSWKKEIFELLLESSFFHFPPECLRDWRTVFDNLFSDKATFNEFLARVSVPQTGSLNIFSSKEIEYELRGMLLKRLAFVLYSSPKDQYTRFMTVVQERLAEAIKMPHMVPIIQAQVFLCFRVLLVRLSSQHLNSLWPTILHEILQTMIQLETDLLTQQQSHLYLYLQLCKLLQVALNLSRLSNFQVSNMFQMYRWTFIGPATLSYTPHLTRIASLLEPPPSPGEGDFDLSKKVRIESLSELQPFLNHPEEELELETLEMGLATDFVE